MAKINGNEIRPGTVIEHDGGLWVAVKTNTVKPGKGGAYNQVELKNLITGTKLNERFRSAETVDQVQLELKDFSFLYEEGDALVFMNTESYEQLELAKDFVGDRAAFLRTAVALGRAWAMSALAFEDAAPVAPAEGEPVLRVDLDGFAGPLDLLLELARRQKVDLARISILALAEQYIAFVEEARRMRLELAADYLVMAAWLAYLKSRLLLPEPPKGEEPSAADLATALALRLRRLEAIREAAKKLGEREQLGRDVFGRGIPEPVQVRRESVWQAGLYDLLSAYARQRQKKAGSHVVMHKRLVWSLVDAREALERIFGNVPDWSRLDGFLEQYVARPEMRVTVLASSFSAALELVREGKLALRQDRAFAPLYLRTASPDPSRASPESVP